MTELSFLFSTAAFLFGTLVGSFLNVLTYRFNTGRSALRGRSRCMHCGHNLSALDLIPFVSFLFLRGKCRYCSAAISSQYIIVELVAGVLSLGVYIVTPSPFLYGLSLFIWMTVLAIVVYDIRHHIIPWAFSITLVLATVLYLYFAGKTTIEDVSAGPLLALPLFLLSLVSLGKWMGWADSIFELSLGWLLGLYAGIAALMIAVWTGALVGVCGVVLARFTPTRSSSNSRRGFTIRSEERLSLKSEIPFAPFLAFGAAVAYFFHVDLFSILSFFT